MEASLTPASRNRSAQARWAILFAVWTLVALLVATQTLLRFRTREDPVPWTSIVFFQLAYWYVWALLTPLIFRLGRAHPIDRDRWLRGTGFHLVAGGALSTVMIAYFAFLMIRIAGEGEDGSTFGDVFLRYMGIGFHYDLLTYWAILGVGLALDYHAKFRERSLRASRLETRLVEAQLQALRMQLQPHFLFNTLHAIASLLEKDPAEARRMIARLSDLLRLTLQSGDRTEVTLREELEVVDCYLEIEACRFTDRMSVHREIDRSCLEALVPSLLLQPVVENAVRHGIGRRTEAGRIEIGARRDGDELELTVRDDGPGLSAGDQEPQGTGIGLANVQARLDQLYGDDASLVLENVEGGGLRVAIRLPYRFGADEAGRDDEPSPEARP